MKAIKIIGLIIVSLITVRSLLILGIAVKTFIKNSSAYNAGYMIGSIMCLGVFAFIIYKLTKSLNSTT